jgi:hypothetical protein
MVGLSHNLAKVEVGRSSLVSRSNILLTGRLKRQGRHFGQRLANIFASRALIGQT